jgi:hypothetical protein
MRDDINEVRTRGNSANTRRSAVRSGCDSTPLTERELEMVAAAGGARGGIMDSK